MNTEYATKLASTVSPSYLRGCHDGIRRALQCDLDPECQDHYGVQEYADWSEWRDILEAEMTSRNISFVRIIF